MQKHPNGYAKYLAVVAEGSISDENTYRLILPKPANDRAAYTVIVENRTGVTIQVGNDATDENELLELASFQGAESNLAFWIAEAVDPAAGLYRMLVLVRPDGVYGVPGASAVLP